jgi:uncharacterized protein (TIGR02246 family)
VTGWPEELHRCFQDAFNRHDLEAVVALYEPDAVLVSSGWSAQGADAIREAYRGYFAMQPTIELQTLGAHRAGDLAMLYGEWILYGTAPDGSPIRSEGRNSEVVRLQPDGHWRFAIDIPAMP